ncbi:MAG: hypothetical protein ACOYXT_15490 [Bacteroidota bacterium]
MKKSLYVLAFIFAVFGSAIAQDEGEVVVKQRFARSKSIYFSVGPSLTLGKNLGDYSAGFNFEGGFLKRKNKVISFGPNISYLFFSYDATKTYPYYYDPGNDLAVELAFTGGDISIISVGFNIKLNLIPVGDDTKFTIYGIATPYLAVAGKSAMTGTIDAYANDGTGVYDDYQWTAEFTGNDVDGFNKESSATGGLHAGFGFEILPAGKVSIFGQATFSYTLPVNYVGTRQYLHEDDLYVDNSVPKKYYYDTQNSLYLDAFPLVKKGFSAVSLKFGLAFNF